MGLPALAALLLSLFVALLLAATPVSPARGVAIIVPSFAAGLLIPQFVATNDSGLALLAGGAAALSLLVTRRTVPMLLLAGITAGAGVAGVLSFTESGVIVLPFWCAALAVVLISAGMASRRPQFAPSILRDQGECAALIASPVVAALPVVEAGWKSALALAGARSSADAPMPGWWLALPMLAVGVGVLHQWWVRR
jgi:hypothetical protein